MAKEAFNPSRCEIKKAELIPHVKENIKSYDISLMIGDFHLNQSIDSVALSGTIDVLDNINLLQGMPMRGEEQLRLTIYCYDKQTEVTLNCQVIKINRLEPTPDTKGMSYTLHWITKLSYESGKRSMIRSFINMKPSTIVHDIFKTYYGSNLTAITKLPDGRKIPDNTKVYNIQKDQGRRLYIEESDNNITVTIPDYSPAEAIQFIVKRTYGSTRSKSSSFRFFERFDGWYFVSDEWLFQNGRDNGAKILNYNPFVELDGANPLEQINGLTQLNYNKRVNTASDILGGAYSNTILEIDILARTAKKYNYNYKDYYKEYTDVGGKTASLGTDVHSEKFISDTFNKENAKQFMIVRDYRADKNAGTFKPENNIREIVAKRNMFEYHSQSTGMTAVTAGRLDIQAGQIVKLDIKEMNAGSQAEKNQQLSGRYLVVAVENHINNGECTTGLALYKFGFSDAAGDKKGAII